VLLPKGLIREAGRVKVREFAEVQYFTFTGKQQYCEGMFKLTEQWDELLNANGDYVVK
jgi:hypothetical protein